MIMESEQQTELDRSSRVSMPIIRALGGEVLNRFLDQLEPHLDNIVKRNPEATEGLASFLESLSIVNISSNVIHETKEDSYTEGILSGIGENVEIKVFRDVIKTRNPNHQPNGISNRILRDNCDDFVSGYYENGPDSHLNPIFIEAVNIPALKEQLRSGKLEAKRGIGKTSLAVVSDFISEWDRTNPV